MLDYSFENVYKFNTLLEQKAESEGPKAKLTYAEDLILERGKDGIKYFNEQILELLKNFQGLETDQMVNAKVDGSPGILFGADPRPQYQGQFFIGVNRAIIGAKNPKAVHDEHDLNTLITNEGLRHVISNLLPYLKNLCAGTNFIYQADVLFSSPEQKKEEVIDGEQCLTFTPNMLTYAVPVESRSQLYKKLKFAKIGIVVHDKCTGKTDESGQQIIPSSVGKQYPELLNAAAKSKDVFVDGSRHESVQMDIDEQSIANLNAKLQKINSIASSIGDDFNTEWITNKPIQSKYQTFVGRHVTRDDGGIFELSKQKAKPNFSKIVDELNKQVLEEYKSASKKESVSAWLNINHDNLEKMLEVFFNIRNIVDDVLDLLYTMESKLGKTFVKLPDGTYQPSRGEGFVLFKHQNHVKFIDRLDFTRSAKLYSKYNMPASVDESLILESQHVFHNLKRILQKDVNPTIQWLEQLTGLQFVETNNILGTTGKKESSGDLDLGINANDHTKEELVAKLQAWCEKNNIPHDKIFNTRERKDKKTKEPIPAFKDGWIDKTGTSVHFKAPINGDVSNGFVQTDFMFLPDLEWSRFALQGSPHEVSAFKGEDKHELLKKLAKVADPNLVMSWSHLSGLLNSETREVISNKPDEVAEKILGNGAKANDITSVENILAFIKAHHLQQKFAPAIDEYKAQFNKQNEIEALLRESAFSFKRFFVEQASVAEIGFFPGAFKPLHTGHIKAINDAAKQVKGPLFVVLSKNSRESEGGMEFTLEQTLELFKLYKQFLPEKVHISVADKTPPLTVMQCLVIMNNEGKYVLGKTPKNWDPNVPLPDPETLVEPSTKEVMKYVPQASSYVVKLAVGNTPEDQKRYTDIFKGDRYQGKGAKAEVIQTLKGWSATILRNGLENLNKEVLEEYIPFKSNTEEFKRALTILYGNNPKLKQALQLFNN